MTFSFNLAPGASLGQAVNAIDAARHELNLPAAITGSFQGNAQACGQRLFGWSSPDGRPASAEFYLTPEYLRERWVLVTRLAANSWNTGQPKALKLNKEGPSATGDLVAHWLSVFAGPSAKAKTFLADLGVDPAQSIADEKRIAQIAGLCAAAPQFQMT